MGTFDSRCFVTSWDRHGSPPSSRNKRKNMTKKWSITSFFKVTLWSRKMEVTWVLQRSGLWVQTRSRLEEPGKWSCNLVWLHLQYCFKKNKTVKQQQNPTTLWHRRCVYSVQSIYIPSLPNTLWGSVFRLPNTSRSKVFRGSKHPLTRYDWRILED